jgi:thymidylate synthase (FAD)
MFHGVDGVPWDRDDAPDDLALVEFAGRACYASWNKPNAATRDNADYVRHIVEVQHYSVLEHAQATFYVDNVSRALTHELIRHRHLSYSQRSTRYVNESDADCVVPDAIESDPQLRARYLAAVDAATDAYAALYDGLRVNYADVDDPTRRRKLARQAARYVLPNGVATALVVTGNYRAWREFVELRGTIHADDEIRELAIEVLFNLKDLALPVFADLVVAEVDGSEVVQRVAINTSTPPTTVDQ